MSGPMYVSVLKQGGFRPQESMFLILKISLARYTSSEYGVAAVNGTSALHLALHMIGVKENDLVIIPNITFIASANAVVYTNADPLFIDVDPGTWQMDLDLLENFLIEKTVSNNDGCFLSDHNTSENSQSRKIAAIMPVHVSR